MRLLRNAPPRSNAAGFALVSALLMLLVIMLLAVSMFRSVGLQEKIAGSTREKQRAFQAAQSALQYGESWLGQNNWSTGSACAGTTATPLIPMQVCSNALATPESTLPWSTAVQYLPPGMTVSTSGGLNSSGDINYYAAPGLYISYAGPSSDGLQLLYTLTAYGYGGGGANNAAVVQSTYGVTNNQFRDLTAP